MTTRAQTNTAKTPTITPLHSGLLQRKCTSCGNHTVAGGDCAECKKHKPLGLQTKLTINEPGDRYEQEADRIADEVMAMPAHSHISRSPLNIQRFSGEASGQGREVPESVHQVLTSPGRPLEPGLRQDMEARFGYDFSQVRVHTGIYAEQSTQDVSAHAYATGRNIVFGTDQYLPESARSRRLVAHELTHVLQQQSASPSGMLLRDHRPTYVLQWNLPALMQVLSGEEVSANPQRKAALDATHQSKPILWTEPDTNKLQGTVPLTPGSIVKIKRVSHPTVVFTDTNEWHPRGSGWLVVERDGKEAGFVLGIFLEPLATAAPNAASLAGSSTTDVLAVATQPRLVREDLASQQPTDFNAVVKAALSGGGMPPQKLDPEVAKLLRTPTDQALIKKLLAGRQPPLVFTVPLKSDSANAQRDFDDWRKNNLFWVPPGADVQFRPVLFPELMVQGKSVAVVTPVPAWARLYGEIHAVPLLSQQLAGYLAPGIDSGVIKPSNYAETARMGRIARNLNSLNAAQRKAFDGQAWGRMHNAEELDMKLSAFVQREKDIAELKSAKGQDLSGSKLEAVLEKHAGKTAAPDTEQRLNELKAEQSRRNKMVTDARTASQADAKAVGQLSYLPDQQLNMLGRMLGRGFLAGAQYEVAPLAWKQINDQISDEPGSYNAGTLAGLIPGAAEGIAEAVVGLVDLLELVGKLGWNLAVNQFKDLAEPIYAPNNFKARKQMQAEQVGQIVDAVRDFINKFAKDPAFLSGPAFEIGVALGHSTGQWINGFKHLSTFDKGYTVGKFVGRVVIEVVMLVAAPEELAARAAATTSIKLGREAIAAIEKLAEAIPALRKLIEAKRVARAAKVVPEAVDAAKAVSTGDKALNAAVDAKKGLFTAEATAAAERKGTQATKAASKTAKAEPRVLDKLMEGEGAAKKLESVVNQRLASHLDEIRPSAVPGYAVEVPIEANHTALRKAKGSWCVHTKEVCDIPVADDIEGAIDRIMVDKADGQGYLRAPKRRVPPKPAGGGKSSAELAREEFDATERTKHVAEFNKRSVQGTERVRSGEDIHHAIELQALDLYPGAFNKNELNAINNMRVIPEEFIETTNEAGQVIRKTKKQLHNSYIRWRWDHVYAELDREIASRGLTAGTPEYNTFVREYMHSARKSIDYGVGNLFGNYKRSKLGLHATP